LKTSSHGQNDLTLLLGSSTDNQRCGKNFRGGKGALYHQFYW